MGLNRLGYRTERGPQIIRTNLITAPTRSRGTWSAKELDSMIELAESGKLPVVTVTWVEELQRFLLTQPRHAAVLEAATRCGLGSMRCVVESPEEDESGVVFRTAEE